MAVVIKGTFSIDSPIELSELKDIWGDVSEEELLELEGKALTDEFSAILGLDQLEKATIEVTVAEV